jgi:hypothetical protein
MIRWIIWYDDGSSFTSDDGEPHEAPRWGVQVIAAYSADHGRVLNHGKDFYWRDGDEWLGGDLVGLVDHLTRPGTTKIVLVGRGVPPAAFLRLLDAADRDPRLPPRSSYSPLETPP